MRIHNEKNDLERQYQYGICSIYLSYHLLTRSSQRISAVPAGLKAASHARLSPNRPGQAVPYWRLHGSFGTARILEKPKPSGQAAAKVTGISCCHLLSLSLSLSLSMLFPAWSSIHSPAVFGQCWTIYPFHRCPGPYLILPSSKNGVTSQFRPMPSRSVAVTLQVLNH
jgi:hypothetical protein